MAIVKPFSFERAETVSQAVEMVGGDAAFLAGGTNLVDLMRLGVSTPERLVDINRLGLDHITESASGTISVGALVRNSDLAAHASILRRCPFVAQAIVAGASGQLRNMATTAGNLMQRTRCIYFADLTTPCNKRAPGSGCSAVEGFGRYNALIGASPHCVAVHPSDLCLPLSALDATVVAEGPDGVRRIPFAEFHRLPGDTPHLDTNLDPRELIVAVEIPTPDWAARSLYRKVRERTSYAFALVSVAAAVDIVDGTVRDVRLALGGVSHRPHRARAAEEALRGQSATAESFQAAAEIELAAAEPGPQNAFKIPQLRNTIVAVLSQLASPAAESAS